MTKPLTQPEMVSAIENTVATYLEALCNEYERKANVRAPAQLADDPYLRGRCNAFKSVCVELRGTAKHLREKS